MTSRLLPLRQLLSRQWRQFPLTAVALLVLWGIAGALVLAGRHAGHDEALREAQLLARVTDDSLRKAVGQLELSLQWTAEHLKKNPQLAPHQRCATPPADPAERTELDRLLLRMLALYPWLQGAAWLNADGGPLAASHTAGCALPPPPALPKDSASASTLDQSSQGSRWQPVVMADTKDATAPARTLWARAVMAGDGHLVVWADALQMAGHLEPVATHLQWRMRLLKPQGETLATSPANPELAERAFPAAQAQASQGDHGAMPALLWDIMGLDWLLGRHTSAAAVGAFRTLRQIPLTLVVDAPLAQVLAQTQARERGIVLAATGLSGVMLLLGWRARRNRSSGREALRQESEARQQLREQFEQNEQLVDAMPVPVFLVDLQGTLLVVNRAWVHWMELDAPADSADHEERQAQVDALIALGSESVRQGHDFHQPLELQHHTGVARETMLSKVPLRNAEGQVTGIIGTLIDITEYRQAERATERARQAAEQTNQLRAEFVANVTHELRTPLQSILGFAELGRGRSAEYPRLQLMFDRIHQSGGRMLRLVEDLLDITRIGSSVGAMRHQITDPVGVVRDVVDELSSLARQKHQVELCLHTDPALAQCMAQMDSHRIAQVVRNVIANALRFSPPHKRVEVALRRELAESGAALFVCTVRDHGPGIPEAELEAIFDPFVQSSRTKDGSGGTGLGLTISRTIMHAHDGSITARNHPDGGAVLRIMLALAAQVTQPAPPESSTPADAATV